MLKQQMQTSVVISTKDVVINLSFLNILPVANESLYNIRKYLYSWKFLPTHFAIVFTSSMLKVMSKFQKDEKDELTFLYFF